MLIEIINLDPAADLSSDDKVSALDNLLRSHRERNHIVMIPRSSLKIISEYPSFSLDAKKAIEELYDSTREYKALVDKLSVITKVDFSSTQDVTNTKNGTQDYITISYDFFLHSIRVQPTTLISENDTDHEMYLQIADGYLKSNSHLASVGCTFQKNCGYGSHISKVYCDYKDEYKFAFCLVDNDRKYPEAPLGSTAGKFNKCDFNVSGTVELTLLSVRELESLIPTEILESLVCDGDYSSSFVDVLDKIRQLDIDSKGEFRKYFDHKDGIFLKDALKPRAKDFWKAFFKSENNISIKDCFKTDECIDCGSCVKINGLGDKTLENSINLIKRVNKRNLIKNLPSTIKSEWHSIGNRAVSWGCTPHGRRARV
ncbi:hypothetical protein [Vibrio crassostreae]|uniref:hypothetical protein n=1 Tax=Vibrio crassostreae TaxID=246167 RepID=UPI00104A0339|nr:hypothetical protein [Vibrio crassostreae]TCV07955.1 hypothetical protein EDB16_11584 [Vibrio crassostreae]TWD60980.1 hypothetical protein FB444_11525 [Vibrio crassostreae]